MKTTVVRARRKGIRGYVNVGRPTVFGNPFVVGVKPTETAREAQEMFRRRFEFRLLTDPAFKAAVLGLRGKVIGCPCAFPEHCHANVIADYLNGLPAGAEEAK